MSDNQRHLSENETFINLIQIAKKDEKIKKTLLNILRLDSFNRKSFLNTYIEQMKLKKAPIDFVEAIASLRDDSIAQKVLEVISK